MEKKIRVLVVDDSAFMRKIVSKLLTQDDSLEVVSTARDGMEAIQKVESLKPDVVTLDIEMPKMDGLQTLSYLMAENPVPCVMLSAYTPKGANITLKALEYGAVDFVQKPSGSISIDLDKVQQELIGKIKIAHAIDPKRLPLLDPSRAQAGEKKASSDSLPLPSLGKKRRAILIGSSTGGPRALSEVVPKLPAGLGCPVLIVQHMSAGFTRSLAERLSNSSSIPVKEAEEGEEVESGKAYLAPGDWHMEVKEKAGKVVVSLNQRPPVLGVRPSVDVLFLSAAQVYGDGCRAMVLTGMGHDGSRGSRAIRDKKGMVFAQDEQSCVVYGMPRSVIEAGCANQVLPLPGMAARVLESLN